MAAIGVIAVAQIALGVTLGWPSVTGQFWGPDSFMRLSRTLTCVGGAACPDGIFPRSNVPYGEVLHWPYLQDRILLVLGAPLTPFMGRHDAVLVAATVLGPLLEVGGVVMVLLAARLFVPVPGLYFAGVLLACQPWVFQAFAAPMADHHGLQGFLFLGALAGALHVLLRPESRRWSIATGAFVGVAFWASTEALVSTLPIAIALLGLWVLRGGTDTARANKNAALSATAVLTLALLIDAPPGDPTAIQYDRFSVVHWTLWAAVAALWGAAVRWDRHLAGPRARLVAAGAGAVVLAAGTWAVFPDFFGGPMVDMDARLAGIWLEHISEFVPVLGKGRALVTSLHLASALLALPAAAVCALRGAREKRGGWALIVASMLWFGGLALVVQGRWALYLQLLVPIPLSWLLGRVLARVPSSGSSLLSPALSVATVLLFAVFPLLFAVPFAYAEARDGGSSPDLCPASVIVPTLRELETMYGPGTVLARVDWGPEILFRTGHRVIASPYHRNAAGLLDSYDFMSARDESIAREIADRRGLDWVVLCPSAGWFPVLGDAADGTLYSRLTNGTGPSWLRPAPLPDSLAGLLKLFRVEGRGSPAADAWS